MYIQAEAKEYTSESYGVYKWKLRHIQVEAKENTGGSYGV
jgi:hypothetical protein